MTPQPPFLLLKAIDAFRALANDELRALYAAAHVVSLASGEKLARAGAPVDALNVVMSGRLIATTEDAWTSEDQPVQAMFAPGAAVDAPRFFAFDAHPMQIIAARPSTVLRLSREDFREAMTGMPHLWENLIAGVVKSSGASATARAPDAAARTIAVCPGANVKVPDAFIRALAEALEAMGACQVLSSAGLGQNQPGGIAIDDPQVMHELEESERVNDAVLYVADDTLTPWTRRCIDRADEVLIVGVDDGDPSGPRIPLSEVERCGLAMAGTRASRLVIIAGRRSGPLDAGSERWLALRPVAAHHFVTLGDRESFARLARFSMGRATVLALTGSGLSGAAHLGVVAALKETGVEIDAVSGAGAGAAIAALLAGGLGPEDINALVRRIFVQSGVMSGARRQTVLWGGRGGLYGHARYDRMINRHIPHGTATELRLPFRGFAANISRARLWTHERDSLQAIVRTNWTPPGVFAPFVTGEGDMLVDGSGAAPPPVEALRALGAGRCFVVQPLPGPLGRAPAAYRDLGNVMLRGLLRRTPSRPGGVLPMIPDISLRAQTPRWFSGDEVADDIVLLQPPMPRGISLLDFTLHSRIMALAQDWAMREIAQLRSDGEPAFSEEAESGVPTAEKKR